MSNLGRYICLPCAKAFDSPGNCSTHADEPLLDTQMAAIRELLVAEDDERRARSMWRLSLIYGAVAFAVGAVIAVEAALSFLGVGLQLPAISWGLMISVAQQRILTSPHLLLFPGIFLSVTVFSFILMGDALRDALDPKLR